MKTITRIFILFMAAFIGYASMGVNVYKYCCDACREHGIDNFHYVSCADVHEKYACDGFERKEQKNDNYCCAKHQCVDHRTHECTEVFGSCDVLRLELDPFAISAEVEIEGLNIIVAFESLYAIYSQLTETSISESISEITTTYQQHKPTSTGLLCLISSYII